MTDQKTDFPPLLPVAGIYAHTLVDLRTLTVDAFPESERRPALFGTLNIYLELLEAAGLRAVVWVDGSFMCAKLEPDDIDLVILFDASAVDALSGDALDVLNNLLNTSYVKSRFNLHVFPLASDDEPGAEFWLQKFGTQRDEITPKGLAELRVNQ